MTSARMRYKAWLEQANFDLKAAGESLKDGYYEWACYQSVQCVEKALKAVIRHAGWHPPKTHKLGVLVGVANKANRLFFEVKLDFRKVEAYATISRYPFIVPGESDAPHNFITKNDAISATSLAQDILGKIESFVGQNRIEKGVQEVVQINNYYYTVGEVDTRLNSITNTLVDSDLDVEKVVLFGSFSRTKASPKSSTMDVLIIANTKLSFIERIQYVRELTRGGEPIIEPLVYTPEEFKYMLEEEGEGFLESAISEGQTIYDSETGEITL